MDIIDHVATAPDPLACSIRGARPPSQTQPQRSAPQPLRQAHQSQRSAQKVSKNLSLGRTRPKIVLQDRPHKCTKMIGGGGRSKTRKIGNYRQMSYDRFDPALSRLRATYCEIQSLVSHITRRLGLIPSLGNYPDLSQVFQTQQLIFPVFGLLVKDLKRIFFFNVGNKLLFVQARRQLSIAWPNMTGNQILLWIITSQTLM